MSAVEFEVDYKQPPAKVWRALTEPELLARWMMPNNIRPELGAEFEFRSKPIGGWDGIARCKMLEVDAPRRLVYSWGSNMIQTVVSFDLAPLPDGGTRLRFKQDGFEGANGFWAKLFMGGGWKSKLRKTVPGIVAGL